MLVSILLVAAASMFWKVTGFISFAKARNWFSPSLGFRVSLTRSPLPFVNLRSVFCLACVFNTLFCCSTFFLACTTSLARLGACRTFSTAIRPVKSMRSSNALRSLDGKPSKRRIESAKLEKAVRIAPCCGLTTGAIFNNILCIVGPVSP